MSKQKLRIVTAGLIAISALTALLIVLPFTALTLTAYLFLVADIVLFLATF